MRALFIVLLVDVAGFGIVIPLLPFSAEAFGASPAVIGFLFASFAAAQFVGVPLLGYLSDRSGRRPVLILSLFGSLAAFVPLAVANGLALLFLARIVDGGAGGNVTTVRAAVADVTDERGRARGFGVIGAAFGIGFVVGPLLGGLLASVRYRLAGWAAAALTVLAIVLVWRWLPETRPEGAEPRDLPWTEARRLLGRHDIRRWLSADLVVATRSFPRPTTGVIPSPRAKDRGSAHGRGPRPRCFAALGTTRVRGRRTHEDILRRVRVFVAWRRSDFPLAGPGRGERGAAASRLARTSGAASAAAADGC